MANSSRDRVSEWMARWPCISGGTINSDHLVGLYGAGRSMGLALGGGQSLLLGL